MSADPREQRFALYRHGQVELDGPVDWPSGTRLLVQPVEGSDQSACPAGGPVVIAGFGLAGRYVADLLDHGRIEYVVVEKNSVTVETQACLGRRIVQGDVSDEATLRSAGIEQASILALTIPDEPAVLKSTSLARRLNAEIYIIARTNYTSVGIKASQLGADDVVKAEQAVALQFYQRLRRRMNREQ
ncbi:MAG: NAD-binding protein [Planctomycetota bacterium]